MGKKKQANSLGRSIIRDRFGSKARRHADSQLHTSEINDGYDWNKINLRSVTEESSLDDFLATAQMAGTDFTAEKLNITFVSKEARLGLLSVEEEKRINQTQDKHRYLLNIPRRPSWDETTTAAELDMKERERFLEWRRKLAELQEIEGIILTPFEKNLEFWRQLWRVIERSDIIVQIVDARNPLLFYSEDLQRYVIEVDKEKLNLILVNKADYLTEKQREMWSSYFDSLGVPVAFWSAITEMEELKAKTKEADTVMADGNEEDGMQSDKTADDKSSAEESETDLPTQTSSDHTAVSDCLTSPSTLPDDQNSSCHENTTPQDDQTVDENLHLRNGPEQFPDDEIKYMLQHQQVQKEDDAEEMPVTDNLAESATKLNISSDSPSNSGCPQNSPSELDTSTTDENVSRGNNCKVLNGSQLIELFKSLHKGKKYTEGITTVGMVGYPNVGKSSTINALLQTKKVPVSATPGRTKHFQTLYLDKTVMLCDCPGLVMPTFVSTKADMVISGILPIDQMRDYVAPVARVCQLIPRSTLENIYGMMIPKPHEGEDPNRPPTPHELLAAYGYMRGYMTHKGIPDYQKAARHILKDFVIGKLLYCTPPPGCNVEEFCPTPSIRKAAKERSHPQPQPLGSKFKQSKRAHVNYTSEVDRTFFEKKEPKMGTMGVRGGVLGYSASDQSRNRENNQSTGGGKPWKKHYNHGRKEKLRRVTSYLDA